MDSLLLYDELKGNMPIKSSQPPNQAIDALQAGATRLRSVPGTEVTEPRPLSLTRNVVQQGDAGVPHQVFHLSLDDVLAGKGVSEARATGWRFLLGQQSAHNGTVADVHGDGVAFEFGGLHHGPQAVKMIEVLQQAERLPGVRDGDFEPRLLRVPSLYVDAIWLKERRTGQDLIIPIPPSLPPLVVGQQYSAPDFEAVLKQEAAARKPAPSPPGTSAPAAP